MQLFNANNLRKTTLGNVEYGGVTYVLNKQAMKGRLFWEAFDAGVTEMYITCSPCCCPCLPPLLPAACCLLPAACCLLPAACCSGQHTLYVYIVTIIIRTFEFVKPSSRLQSNIRADTLVNLIEFALCIWID
eukprot:COSAG06_NODE_353_length_16899_cov_14.694345_5_plen_132_part_00